MEQMSPPTHQQGSVPKIRALQSKPAPASKQTTVVPTKAVKRPVTAVPVKNKKTAINEDIADALSNVYKTISSVTDNETKINACLTIQRHWRRIQRGKLMRQAAQAIRSTEVFTQQRKMKLQKELQGRQSIDDPFHWDQKGDFNRYSDIKSPVKKRPSESDSVTNKLQALNDLLQKKAFEINDEDDFEKFLDKLNQRRAADLGD